MRFLDLKRFLPSFVVLGFRNILEVALCFFGVSVGHRFGFKRSARELGLRRPSRERSCFLLSLRCRCSLLLLLREASTLI
jgi:hypothetical protein